jgi:hypothetical protein
VGKLSELQGAFCFLFKFEGIPVAFVIRDLLQALSGKPIDLLPPLPAHEEILGVMRRMPAEVTPIKIE